MGSFGKRWLACVLVLILTASACAGSALAPGGTSSPGAAGTGDIAIGFQTPLSAPGAVALGQQAQRGAELGVEYVNSVMGGVLGGRKLVMYIEDTQGQNETGIAGYRRLVSEKKVVMTFGYIHSSVLIAVNEVAKELGVPTMATGASASDVTAKHYDTAFRVHFIDPARATVWLELIKAKSYGRVALIAEDSDYGVGLVNELRVQTPKFGVKFELQTNIVDRTAVDVTPQLLKIKDWKPDLVINITTGKQQDLVVDQAAQIGLFPASALLNAGPEALTPTFWQLHPKNGVGLMASAYFHPKQPLSDAAQWMTAKYKAKYNEDVVYFAANAFAQAVIIAQALDVAKSTDSKKLIAALETGSFKGWSTQPVTLPKADGVYWHNWSPAGLIVQYTQPNQDWRDATIIVQASK
jgi:branched-chain amino acid transport system substrate-binding protein